MTVWSAIRRALGSEKPAASGSDLNPQYDQQTSQVMARVLGADSQCVDVGCHYGTVLDEMLHYAPAGRHFAFEPLPDMFKFLREKYAARPNVFLHEMALSDTDGEATFQHVVTNPAYSGLRIRRYNGQEQLVEIKVKLGRLDDVLPADARIKLVKIDVEGAELQVLRGAEKMLSSQKPFVVFEHGWGAADFYGTRPEDVWDLFHRCGMEITLMSEWLAGRSTVFTREAFALEFDGKRNYYFLAKARS